LGLAAVSGNTEIIELLLKANANKNDGLDVAAEIGNKEVVELLLNSGAELNPSNRPPAILFAIGYGGRPLTVKLLLDRGGNAKWRSKSGQTLLHILVNGAVTSPKERSYAGKSWTVKPEDYEEIARLLLAHGADPRARNERGETPISQAQAKGLTGILAIIKK
jgi:ankyrin repeat protein